MCPRAWGMEAREEGNPCSLTAEVGLIFSYLAAEHLVIIQVTFKLREHFHIWISCFQPTADDNATIRVTNLSEDTRETDLQELFRPFGSISRIYLAKDKNTGQSKVIAQLLVISFIFNISASVVRLDVISSWCHSTQSRGTKWFSCVIDKFLFSLQGFAFISFHRREDASRAIAGVSGFGYDHLILNVEWAK